jgi:hypothetical protein
MKWKDMVAFTANDVEEKIKASLDPGPLKSVLIHKKLGYIFKYAKHGTLQHENGLYCSHCEEGQGWLVL